MEVADLEKGLPDRKPWERLSPARYQLLMMMLGCESVPLYKDFMALWRQARKSLEGSRKKGRKAKRGSVRAYLDINVPGWRGQQNLTLAKRLAKRPEFEGRSVENLRQAVRDAKKVKR